MVVPVSTTAAAVAAETTAAATAEAAATWDRPVSPAAPQTMEKQRKAKM